MGLHFGKDGAVVRRDANSTQIQAELASGRSPNRINWLRVSRTFSTVIQTVIAVASLAAQQIGHTPTIFPAPGTGGTPGSLCWQEMRSNGTNKVCLSIPDSIASDYTLKLPSATGSTYEGLGLASAGQLGWIDYEFQMANVVRTSSTRLTIGSNCSVARPCRVRVGTAVYDITASATVDVTSGSGTAYIRQLANVFLVGASGFSVTCTGCATDTATDFDVETGIPLYVWNATSGAWASTGTDRRSGRSVMLPIVAGTNTTVSHNSLAYAVNARTTPESGTVWISDYATASGSSTCGRDIAADINSAIAALPSTGGTVFFGAGTWCSTAIQVTKNNVTFRGIAASGNAALSPSVWRWYSNPASEAALVQWYHTKGGGMRDIQISGNSFSNTRLLELVNASRMHFENVNGRHWASGPGVYLTTDAAVDNGSCHITMVGMRFIEPVDTGNASGLSLDGDGTHGTACSVTVMSSEFEFSRLGSTNAGIYIRGADNDRFVGVNSAATLFSNSRDRNCGSGPPNCDSNNSRPALLIEQLPSNTQFPQVIEFFGFNPATGQDASGQGLTRAINVSAGTGRVSFYGVTMQEVCGIANCLPALSYASGFVDGRWVGSSNAVPEVFWTHDTSVDSLSINQQGTASNAVGSISFARNGTTLYREQINSQEGINWHTSRYNGAGFDAISAKWRLTHDGNLTPLTNSTYKFGSETLHVSENWASEFFSYTNNAFGLQDNTFESDNQINFYCDTYTAGSASDRCGYHMRRARGTKASPSNVTSGDRMGTIAGWGRVSTGFDAATRIDFYADTVSGNNITSSIRFATKNAGGSLADWLTIPGTGGATIGGVAFSSLPSSGNGTIIYCTDCTRATTCAGSGTGAFAHRINSAWSCADASGSGTVTSVALTVPSILSVSGSPITTSGTLAVTLATQSANTVFKGPNSGGAATPTFAALVDADIPDTITVSNYLPLAGGAMTGAITGATRYDSYSSGAVDHVWQTDTSNINHYYDQYSGSTNDRAGINMRRSRGTRASPTAISSGDRLGVIAWWANTSSSPTFAAVTRVDSFATAISGSNVTSKLVFATANNSTSATDWVQVPGDGGIQLLTGTKPTCDSAHQFVFFAVNGSGVKDTVEVCAHDAGGTYAWRTIY